MDEQSPVSFLQAHTFMGKLKDIVKNPATISLGVLFLLSFGASVYILFFYTTQSLPPPANTSSPQTLLRTNTTMLTPTISATDTPVPTDSPTPVPAISANWNTFALSQFGYTIKYPTDWTVTNNGQLDPKTPSFIIFNPLVSSGSAKSITISYSTRTAAELSGIYGDPATAQKITLGVNSAMQYNRKNSDGVKSVSIILPLTTNNIIFYATQQYQPVLFQMLQTFLLTQ